MNTKKPAFDYIICSPLGTYTRAELHSKQGAFLADDELVVFAFDCASPDAFRKTLINLTLASDMSVGLMKVYLMPFKHRIYDDISQLSLEQIKRDIRDKSSSAYKLPSEVFPEFDQYQNAKGASLPLILGGTHYHFVDNALNVQRFEKLNSEIDEVYTKSLFAVCKIMQHAAQLSCHLQFQTQANHYLLLALLQMKSSRWYKPQPVFIDMLQRIDDADELQVAFDMTPIEHVRLYTNLINCLQTHFF